MTLTGRGWRKTIVLKQYLSDDGSSENSRVVASKVFAVLRRQREYEQDDEFLSIADEFEDLATSDDGTCADFNEVMSSLYDWADATRVWIA